jgi:hypothetical protein
MRPPSYIRKHIKINHPMATLQITLRRYVLEERVHRSLQYGCEGWLRALLRDEVMDRIDEHRPLFFHFQVIIYRPTGFRAVQLAKILIGPRVLLPPKPDLRSGDSTPGVPLALLTGGSQFPSFSKSQTVQRASTRNMATLP